MTRAGRRRSRSLSACSGAAMQPIGGARACCRYSDRRLQDGEPVNTTAPDDVIRQLTFGAIAPKCLHVAAELRVADHLSGGPLGFEELGRRAGAHGAFLARALRLLCTQGVFTEPERGVFANTPSSELLREEDPAALRAAVLFVMGEMPWRALGLLDEAVIKGRSAIDLTVGTNPWDYLEDHPAESELFDRMMLANHGPEPAAVAAAVELPEAGHVLDAGGGIGTMLATLLAARPKLTGTIMDRDTVIPRCAVTFAKHGVTDRARAVPGDLFTAWPGPNDLIVLSHILHDWNDQDCLKILARAREAITDEGQVFVVEMVLPEGDAFHPGKNLDVAMMAFMSGRERTEVEYGELLAAGGLSLDRVVATQSAASVVVARKASS